MSSERTEDDLTFEDLMLDALTSIGLEITDGDTSFGIRRENKSSTWGGRLTVKRFPRDVYQTSLDVDRDAGSVAELFAAAIAAKGRVAAKATVKGRHVIKGWVFQGLATHACAIVAEVSDTAGQRSRVEVQATALKSLQNRRPARTAVESLIAGLRSDGQVTLRDAD